MALNGLDDVVKWYNCELEEGSIEAESPCGSFTKINLYKKSEPNCVVNRSNGLPIAHSLKKVIKGMELQNVKVATHNEFSQDVVVVPDIHGDLPGLLTILRGAGLIDTDGNWIGGTRKLVQLGDFSDRGKYSIETYLYLRTLQEQSKDYGDCIQIILGNHEMTYLEGKCNPSYLNSMGGLQNVNAFTDMLKRDLGVNIHLMATLDETNAIFTHAGFDKLSRELFVYEQLCSKKEELEKNGEDISLEEEDLLDRLDKEIEIRKWVLFDEDNMVLRHVGNNNHMEVKNEINRSIGKGKISNSELINWMDKNSKTNNDIVNWADGCLCNHLNYNISSTDVNKSAIKYDFAKEPKYLSEDQCSLFTQLITWQRSKFQETITYGDRSLSDNPHEKLKPKNYCGHNISTNGIATNGSNYYVDVGMSYYGNREFLAIDVTQDKQFAVRLNKGTYEWEVKDITEPEQKKGQDITADWYIGLADVRLSVGDQVEPNFPVVEYDGSNFHEIESTKKPQGRMFEKNYSSDLEHFFLNGSNGSIPQKGCLYGTISEDPIEDALDARLTSVGNTRSLNVSNRSIPQKGCLYGTIGEDPIEDALDSRLTGADNTRSLNISNGNIPEQDCVDQTYYGIGLDDFKAKQGDEYDPYEYENHNYYDDEDGYTWRPSLGEGEIVKFPEPVVPVEITKSNNNGSVFFGGMWNYMARVFEKSNIEKQEPVNPTKIGFPIEQGFHRSQTMVMPK